MSQEKKVKNIEIVEILKIPKTTLQDWKKRDNYQGVIFEILKSYTAEELREKVEKFKVIKNIEEVEKRGKKNA